MVVGFSTTTTSHKYIVRTFQKILTKKEKPFGYVKIGIVNY